MNMLNVGSGIVGIFLLLSSVLPANAEKITIQPSTVSAIEQACDLESPENAKCLSAKTKVESTIVSTEKILTLAIDKKGLPIAFIKMETPINNVGCYWLKIFPKYYEKIGTHCTSKN